MDFQVKDGIYNLDFKLSNLEKKLFNKFSDKLENKGFQYLSIPSSIYRETLIKQDVITLDGTYHVDKTHCLSGSSEQGILQYFQNKEVIPMKIYAQNQCFRVEDKYDQLIHLKEFIKIEQFCFCNKEDWENNFEILLNNSTEFLADCGIQYRVKDVTNEDLGYHIKKCDIEIYTKKYGWIESHSCTYFCEEQTKRFNISGANHTISNTGIASPRILIPFIENENLIKLILEG